MPRNSSGRFATEKYAIDDLVNELCKLECECCLDYLFDEDTAQEFIENFLQYHQDSPNGLIDDASSQFDGMCSRCEHNFTKDD